jgi:hypothetical protein
VQISQTELFGSACVGSIYAQPEHLGLRLKLDVDFKTDDGLEGHQWSVAGGRWPVVPRTTGDRSATASFALEFYLLAETGP